MIRRSPLARAVPSFLLSAACAIQTISNPVALSADVIPFELVTGHIVLKVNVNNSRPLSFVLDTGAKPAIIKLDRAKELGLQLHGQVNAGGAGSGAASRLGAFVQGANFSIPEVAAFSQP